MVYRALQIANSDPKGPAYLMGPREVMEEEVPQSAADSKQWVPIGAAALPDAAADELARDLASARRPLVVTSYLGRNPEAVEELVKLAGCLGLGVLESVPNYLNFPTDHPLYVGGQGNEPVQNPALAEADVVLVLDSDVPWIPLVNKPAPGARVYHIDIDPLKEQMPLWYIPAMRVFRADAASALQQIHQRAGSIEVDKALVEERRAHYTRLHQKREEKLQQREQLMGDTITPEFLTACVRRHIDPETLVLNEGITNYTIINDHVGRTLPRTRFTSGASSLGWGGGAAIGMKLAHPEKTVVCMTGDGSYIFSQPSTVYWMARRYQTPFLQVIFNNRGWKAPKMSALAVHPDGFASKSDDLNIAFDPVPDYSGIAAAAGGAFARIVKKPDELNSAIEEALRAVKKERRAAVLDVWLAHL
jgi:acetolactate synthase-1/2/3 large subunit